MLLVHILEETVALCDGLPYCLREEEPILEPVLAEERSEQLIGLARVLLMVGVSVAEYFLHPCDCTFPKNFELDNFLIFEQLVELIFVAFLLWWGQ